MANKTAAKECKLCPRCIFHQKVFIKWGGLAIILTAAFLINELLSQVTPGMIANIGATILGIGIIIAMIVTVARTRMIKREWY